MKKRCSKCKKEKPVTEFSKNNFSIDGLCFWCKECSRENCKQWRLDHPNYKLDPEKNKASFKKWYSNPENRKLHALRRKKNGRKKLIKTNK